MIVFIQLTTAGANTGPFTLYSDVDGYTNPFAITVPKAILVTGSNFNVPDGTTTIKVSSQGVCVNFITIPVQLEPTTTTTTTTSTTTTTTTTTSIPCLELCFEGIYAEGDPVHPDGGTLVYIDCLGVEDTIPSIFIETGVVTILAQSVISGVGCVSVACPTTTTTTTTTTLP